MKTTIQTQSALRQPTDDQLIDRVLDGNQHAFTLLFNRHERLLRFVLRRYLTDSQAIDEVLQDTFLRAFRALPAFRRESKLGTWLSRIAATQAISYLRSKRNAAWAPLDDTRPQTDAAARSDAELERSDVRRLLHHAISQLSVKDATTIELFYLREHSIEEIRQITGWSVSDIKSRLCRTRRHLRAMLSANAFYADLAA